MHINYILVVWEQEETNSTVSVRNYKTKEQNTSSIWDFKNEIINEIKERRI